MNILFFSTLMSPWGGSEMYWFLTSQYALEKGDKIMLSLYDQQTENEKVKAIRAKGAKVQKRPNEILIRQNSIPSRLTYKIRKRKLFNSFIKEIERFNPDVVILSLSNTFEAFWQEQAELVIHKFKGKVVLLSTFHEEHKVLPYTDILKARSVFNAASKIIFASHRNRLLCEHQIAKKIPDEKVTILRAPVGFDIKGPVPYKTGETVAFCHMARFEVAIKGHDILLRVLSTPIWKQRDWVLNFYGEGGDREYLEDLVKFYGLNDRVFFKGHASNLVEEWSQNDIMLMPSFAEGTPIVLMIAMLCGRPAIVTDVAGHAELIEEGKTGFLANAPDFKDFDEAMERAWKNRGSWKDMGMAAFEKSRMVLDMHPEITLYDLLNILVK